MADGLRKLIHVTVRIIGQPIEIGPAALCQIDHQPMADTAQSACE